MSDDPELPDQKEPSTPSANERLTRTDRFLIVSMLTDAQRKWVKPDATLFGDLTPRSILRVGSYQLRQDLQPRDPFESLRITSLLNTQKTAWSCFAEAEKNENCLQAWDINLKYAFQAVDLFIRLSDRLVSHWVKHDSFPRGARGPVPLTPSTVIEGATLFMEWARIALYLDLNPRSPFEATHADLVVRTQRAAWYGYHEANWKKENLCVREMSLKYNLKAIELSDRLLARLESYRAKSIERGLHSRATGGRKPNKIVRRVNGNGAHP